ncbi:MAG: class I SAM-dependent methyltransferase [Fibromonadaceae bacterium]|jgi:2-polyprenyl-3-methyl-5-hydroxy-6-metoxy-1,4-benzoquinol methylase/uncharacterized protein YbaR (Trm112 family)|nr:class I SAM-dependent methyltransferase [Fibromonadaceae bacterium]
MQNILIQYHCPICGNILQLSSQEQAEFLACPNGHTFSIVSDIPRFVPADNYASSFGLQWNKFRKTQLDSYTNTSISQDRLARILGGLDWLQGKTVLEAGCGAGRFSEVLLQSGALLHSLDLSNAVEAARTNCSNFPNFQVCQANILAMPFSPKSFDAVVCIGVIQHTPNPEETITALAKMVKEGGMLFIDHYAPSYPMTFTRRILRNFLLKKDAEYCIRFCTKLRNLLWPLHVKLHTRKKIGLRKRVYRLFFRISPVVDYQSFYPQLSQEILREWALLDTHDLLTDVYKHFRTTSQIQQAFVDNRFEIVRCVYAGNGVEAAGVKLSLGKE